MSAYINFPLKGHEQADKTEQGSLKSLSLSFSRRTLTLSIISTYQGWAPVTLMLDSLSKVLYILVPRAHDPFGLRQGSRPLAGAR